MTDTPIGVLTDQSATSQPPAASSLIIEKCQCGDVPAIMQGPGGIILPDSSGTTNCCCMGFGPLIRLASRCALGKEERTKEPDIIGSGVYATLLAISNEEELHFPPSWAAVAPSSLKLW